jgi:hypothetical protein
LSFHVFYSLISGHGSGLHSSVQLSQQGLCREQGERSTPGAAAWLEVCQVSRDSNPRNCEFITLCLAEFGRYWLAIILCLERSSACRKHSPCYDHLPEWGEYA